MYLFTKSKNPDPTEMHLLVKPTENLAEVYDSLPSPETKQNKKDGGGEQILQATEYQPLHMTYIYRHSPSWALLNDIWKL